MGYDAIRVEWDIMREISYTDLNSLNWELVGTSFDYQIRLLKVISTLDVDVRLSKTGVDSRPNDIVPARSGFIYDLTSNRTDQGKSWNLNVGDKFYAKALATGTEGALYIVALYATTA